MENRPLKTGHLPELIGCSAQGGSLVSFQLEVARPEGNFKFQTDNYKRAKWSQGYRASGIDDRLSVVSFELEVAGRPFSVGVSSLGL